MQLFIFMKRWHLASLLQFEKVARFTATDEVLLKYISEINHISLCSHLDMRPNLTLSRRRRDWGEKVAREA